ITVLLMLFVAAFCVTACGQKSISFDDETEETAEIAKEETSSTKETTTAATTETTSAQDTTEQYTQGTTSGSQEQDHSGSSEPDREHETTKEPETSKAEQPTTKEPETTTKEAETSKPTQPATKETETTTEPTTPEPTTPEVKLTTCHVTVDGGGDAGVFYSGYISFEGELSVFDLLVKTGVSYDGNSTYVREINGLREKEHGPMSGWLYQVNGKTPMIACGSYFPKDGDEIYWWYQYDE
ncbi:MAG: DUF4430 domain-containing protein, partial [Oscillospiraceae bacterium]|nr:DUF4430 domain-containing protein [Oscillospiraceae bacterium]